MDSSIRRMDIASITSKALRKEWTFLSLPIELQIYILEHIKLTKYLVHARLVCRHINLLVVDIVKRRLRSDLISPDGARCFIACNFRDPKWKEVGDLPRLASVSIEQLEFVIEEPFLPRSLVSLVNTLPESSEQGGGIVEHQHPSTNDTILPLTSGEAPIAPDLLLSNVFTDEFDCEMAVVLFSPDGKLKGAETLYDGELRFRPRYDSPSRRGSLTDITSNNSAVLENNIATSIYLTTSGREILSGDDYGRTVLNVVPRPEWEWRTDRSPSWIPCEAHALPGTDRQYGSIVLDDVRLEYHLVRKEISEPSPTTSPTQQTPSLSNTPNSTATSIAPPLTSSAMVPTAQSGLQREQPKPTLEPPKTMTVIGIEIKKLVVKTGLVLEFLHNQLPEIQLTRVVRMPGPVLMPLPPFPASEAS